MNQPLHAAPPHTQRDAPQRLRWRLALAALFWYATIVGSVPLARPVVDALRAAHLLTVAICVAFALLVVATSLLLAHLYRKGLLQTRQSTVAIALTCAAIGLAQWIEQPEERWHLIQYGILGALLWASSGSSGWRRIMPALAIAAACGWLEEGVQYLVPERYYDLRDVVLNALSGAVGVAVMEGGARMKPGDT